MFALLSIGCQPDDIPYTDSPGSGGNPYAYGGAYYGYRFFFLDNPDQSIASFHAAVLPALQRAGCAVSRCHDDRASIAEDFPNFHNAQILYSQLFRASKQGKRIDLAVPQESLLLQLGLPTSERNRELHHPTAYAWHRDASDYKLILRWISEGARNN